MDTSSNDSIDAGLTTNGPAPSPRAFAIGTGAVFQTVGGLLTMAAIVMAIASAWGIPRSQTPVQQWSHFFQKEHLSSALWTIVLMTSLVGGLAMAAVGVGLQGERRSSGRAAMFVCAILTLVYAGVAATFLVSLGRIIPMLIALTLTALTSAMFMLAGHSASVLRQHPPPPDLNKATPELLEEFRQKRLERLKHYEP